MARVFLSKGLFTFVGNMGINSVGTESVFQTGQTGKTKCLASISRKALLARYLRDTVVSIWPDSSHSNTCRAHDILHGMLSREIREIFFSLPMLESSHHSLYHTTLTMKSHNTYRVQQIEYNYNQICHRIKANKTSSCK